MWFIFYHQSHIRQKSDCRVMGHNAARQSNHGIFENVISRERSELWSLFMSCRQILWSSLSWYYHFGSALPGMLKVPKIRSLHIFAISPEKHGGLSWFFCLLMSTKVFNKLVVSLWVCVASYAQSTLKTSWQYLWNISRKMWRRSLFCRLQINIKGFLMCVCTHACTNYPK